MCFSPLAGEFPSSNFAVLDTRNARPIATFDPSTDWSIRFTGVFPQQNTAAGIAVQIAWSTNDTTTSRVVRWQAAFERLQDETDDTDNDGFQANAVNAWQANHTYSAQDAVNGSGDKYQCSTGGTSGGSEPAWASAATVSDGSVTWKKVSFTTLVTTGTCPATAGALQYTTLQFSSAQIDGLQANEQFRLHINRDADATFGTDDCANNAEIHSVQLRSL